MGKEFDINGLSYGEKQLFLRGLSLKFLEANSSIILIDEPEISLYPINLIYNIFLITLLFANLYESGP